MDKKICSFCREEVSVELRRCPYCGSLLGLEKKDLGVGDGSNQNNNSGVNVAQMYVEQNDDGTIVIKECEEISTGEKPVDNENLIEANLSKSRALPQYMPSRTVNNKLSNGMKVFLTILSTIIPGLGQLIGIIISVIFLNSEDPDRNSFGVALMVSSLLFFVFSCLSIFIAIMVFALK